MEQKEYTGSVSQDFLAFDTANINVYEWFSNFPKDQVSSDEKKLIERLLGSIEATDSKTTLNFADDRFIIVAVNLFMKIDKSDYSFGVVDYLIYYRYLQLYFDDTSIGMDALLSFVNNLIGFSFGERTGKGEISETEYQTLKDLALEISKSVINKFCPLFIQSDITEAKKRKIKPIKTTEIEVEEKPTDLPLEGKETSIERIKKNLEQAEEELDEIEEPSEEVIEQPTTSEKPYIEEWKSTITKLRGYIDMFAGEATQEELEEWNDAIAALQEGLMDEGVEFEFGGQIQSYGSPSIGGVSQNWGATPKMQFAHGGVVQSFSSPSVLKFSNSTINEVGNFFERGGTIGAKYQHKHIPSMTFTITDYTNKGVKGIQKDSKSLSKKERTEGIVVYYSKADLKDLWSLSHATGGKIGFSDLSKKVAKNYEGKSVPKEYQSQYGKTYSKEEAREVGDKVAAKVKMRKYGKMADGGVLVDSIKSRLAKGSFELPLETAVLVPSTKGANEVINKAEFQRRVYEVEKYLSQLFGGYTAVSTDGGYVSSEKGLIEEDVTKVTAFAQKLDFENNFGRLMSRIKSWCRQWSQESMGFEFEGDLFYIGKDSKI